MHLIKRNVLAALVAGAIIVPTANAATVQVVGTGGGNDGQQAYATGIADLVVGSTIYNVTFLAENQSFNNAFNTDPFPGPQTFDGPGTWWEDAEPVFNAILTALDDANVSWVGPTGEENEFYLPYLAATNDVRSARGYKYIPGVSGTACGTGLNWALCAGPDADASFEFNRNDVSVIPWAQVTVVPVPAAVWLFGTGLVGLIGLTRRKSA